MKINRVLLVALGGALWVSLCSACSAASANPTILVGTNTLADAGAINAAIASSPEGAEVVFRGKFLINRTIRLLGNRSYRGESRAGTILRQADGARLPALLASSSWLDNRQWTDTPTAVRHLTLDGNRKGNPGAQTCGLVLRSWLTVVEDLYITGMGGDGLRLTSLSANGARLRNSQVNGRISDSFIENSGRHGVCVEDPGNSVTDWLLRDNWIAGSGADGIHMDNAAGWIIERNHIYGVPHDAIYAHRCFATSISGNYIEGFGEVAEGGTWCGIRATIQGDAASTIAGNRIFSFGGEKESRSTYRYIALSVNYGAGVVTVTGNAIRGSDTSRGIGLYYAAQGKCTLTVVSAANAVEKVKSARVVEGNVTVTAGQ